MQKDKDNYMLQWTKSKQSQPWKHLGHSRELVENRAT